MNTKCPYTYPQKTRAAMVDYLAEHDSYGGWNHPYRRWSPLSWNVKIYGFNQDGKRGEVVVNPAFDDAWQEYVANDSDLFNSILENMQRSYLESEYTTYPGDDQGQWEFCFSGRSGGHMLLTAWKASGVDFLKDFGDAEDWRDWLETRKFEALRTLYRAVRCMDQDFTRAKLVHEVEYQLNWQRGQWEEMHADKLVGELAVAGLEPCPVI